MELSNLMVYGIGGCVVVAVLILVLNFTVNVIIKQFTQRALHTFQQQLFQETTQALATFKKGVCEQMALQESKSDALAKLYAAQIDLLRDGKSFIASTAKGEPFQTEKTLRTFEGASNAFSEQNRKLSLHFSDDFKMIMEGFLAEQEGLIQFFENNWKSNSRDSMERKLDNELIRQAWTKFEDKAASVMESMRSEFRNRGHGESIMSTWLTEVPQAKPVAAIAQK
jgi:cell division protein FtsL